MIRKLIVLALVLGLASIAGAAWEIRFDTTSAVGSTPTNWIDPAGTQTINVGDSIFIGLYGLTSDGPSVGNSFTIFSMKDPFPYNWTGNVGTANGGVTANAGTGTTVGPAGYFYPTNVPPAVPQVAYTANTPVATGVVLWWEAIAQNVGFDNVALDTAKTDRFGIDIVPEPMTIALLGLGGLFLRRRK